MRARARRTRIWGPVVLSGLGLLAALAAVALLWDGQRAAAWFALAVAALEAALTAHEIALRWRGELVQDRWVGAPPVALTVGVLLLLLAILY